MKTAQQTGAQLYAAITTSNTTLTTGVLTAASLQIRNLQYGTSYTHDVTTDKPIGTVLPVSNGHLVVNDALTMSAYDSTGVLQASAQLQVNSSGNLTALSIKLPRNATALTTVVLKNTGLVHYCRIAQANVLFASGVALLGGFELVAGAAAAPATLGVSAIGGILGFAADVANLIGSYEVAGAACAH